MENIKILKKHIKNDQKFNKYFEEIINKTIDSIADSNPAIKNQLLTLDQQKEKLKHEMRKTLQFSDLSGRIELAFRTLAQAKNEFEKETFAAMVREFNEAFSILNAIEIPQLQQSNFKTHMHISDATMDGISDFALKKFEEGKLAESLALYSLLTALHPENDFYWYRFALLSHQSANLDQALLAYAVTSFLNPLLLGARVFSAECYLEKGMRDDALEELKEAYKIAEKMDRQDKELECLLHLEEMLKVA